MSRRKAKADPQTALLGDLESIKSLLDQEHPEAAPPAPKEPPPEEHVPLLDDVVDGALTVDESPLLEQETIVADAVTGLDDDMFKALLSDEWQITTAKVLEDARAQIEQHSSSWTPENTDQLNEALRTRIDEALGVWLKQLVVANMSDLRSHLAEVLAATLRLQIDKVLPENRPDESTHGE